MASSLLSLFKQNWVVSSWIPLGKSQEASVLYRRLRAPLTFVVPSERKSPVFIQVVLVSVEMLTETLEHLGTSFTSQLHSVEHVGERLTQGMDHRITISAIVVRQTLEARNIAPLVARDIQVDQRHQGDVLIKRHLFRNQRQRVSCRLKIDTCFCRHRG